MVISVSFLSSAGFSSGPVDGLVCCLIRERTFVGLSQIR